MNIVYPRWTYKKSPGRIDAKKTKLYRNGTVRRQGYARSPTFGSIMIRPRILALGTLCSLALVAAMSLQANDGTNNVRAADFDRQARRFVTGTVNTAAQLAARAEPGLKSSKRRQRRISGLLARRVETRSLTQFVLGPFGRRANAAERQRFENALRGYLARLISGEISAFSKQKFSINRVVPAGERHGDVLVLSRITGKSGLPLRVDWRVRPTSAGPKLVDVIVEGLSLAVAQRAEVVRLLRLNGGRIDALIARLEGRSPPSKARPAEALAPQAANPVIGVANTN